MHVPKTFKNHYDLQRANSVHTRCTIHSLLASSWAQKHPSPLPSLPLLLLLIDRMRGIVDFDLIPNLTILLCIAFLHSECNAHAYIVYGVHCVCMSVCESVTNRSDINEWSKYIDSVSLVNTVSIVITQIV